MAHYLHTNNCPLCVDIHFHSNHLLNNCRAQLTTYQQQLLKEKSYVLFSISDCLVIEGLTAVHSHIDPQTSVQRCTLYGSPHKQGWCTDGDRTRGSLASRDSLLQLGENVMKCWHGKSYNVFHSKLYEYSENFGRKAPDKSKVLLLVGSYRATA